jgi:hypothetical protein
MPTTHTVDCDAGEKIQDKIAVDNEEKLFNLGVGRAAFDDLCFRC